MLSTATTFGLFNGIDHSNKHPKDIESSRLPGARDYVEMDLHSFIPALIPEIVLHLSLWLTLLPTSINF